MIPHQPCRFCGQTDDWVRFYEPDLCQACKVWIYYNGPAGASERNIRTRKQKMHLDENNCPECGGFKTHGARFCTDCNAAGMCVGSAVCPICQGVKKHEAKTCRACYRVMQKESLLPCRVCGVARGRRRFYRKDLCANCCRRLKVESRPGRVRIDRTSDEAAQVDPALAAFLAARRRRKARKRPVAT